jgi:FkbM family methyltransferase
VKVAIYGAGLYGQAFYKGLIAKHINIDCFIDEYTNKKELCNLPIYRIKDIKNKDIKVFISVSLHDNETIPNTLKSYQFSNIFSFTESLLNIDTILPYLMKTNILWMRENNSSLFHHDMIDDTRKLLTDQESKEIFNNILNFRQTLDMKYYEFPSSQIQYFPDDIKLFSNISSIKLIDCGAYIGDTVESMMEYSQKNNIKVDSIVSFEADAQNIEKLNLEVAKQKNMFQDTDFFVYPAGIWSENTILNFANNGNSASCICDTNNDNSTSIPVFNLDSTVKNINSNYIKMDIEGAEQEAIKGAKKIIKNNNPILAISLYHKPEDLWEIPLLINSINSNYNMYLRVYGHLGLETLLYCVPKVNV